MRRVEASLVPRSSVKDFEVLQGARVVVSHLATQKYGPGTYFHPLSGAVPRVVWLPLGLQHQGPELIVRQEPAVAVVVRNRRRVIVALLTFIRALLEILAVVWSQSIGWLFSLRK